MTAIAQTPWSLLKKKTAAYLCKKFRGRFLEKVVVAVRWDKNESMLCCAGK